MARPMTSWARALPIPAPSKARCGLPRASPLPRLLRPPPDPRKQGNPNVTNSYRIAVIPGDGIGKEVVPEGLKVLNAACAKFDIAMEFQEHDFASCDYYAKHGQMMPDDW